MVANSVSQKQSIEYKAGIEHVEGNLRGHLRDESTNIEYIELNKGNVDFCKRQLATQSIAIALMSWFRDHDLKIFKQAAYTAAKIDRIRQQDSPWFIGQDLVGNLFGTWYWLVSDYEPLVAWRRDSEPFRGWTGEQERPKSLTKGQYDDIFAGYQLTLALRGEWDRLGERTERWLADPPPALKKISPDMKFFLALAKGDISGMETALAEIVTPRQRRWRDNWQHGYTHWFISDEAVVYAKLAWRHGYQVDVDTPYIPKEWLPVASLAEYADPYDFMRDFDIGQPLPEED